MTISKHHILWLVTCHTADLWLADHDRGWGLMTMMVTIHYPCHAASRPAKMELTILVTETGAWHQWPSCDNTFTHRDTHNAPESNKFNKNILFCWRHDPARRELMGDFYDSKTRITNGAFTLALSSQPLNWTLFMIDLTELDFYCSNFVFGL